MSKEKFPHVALVGHMGSGKSTVGPLLGKLMKCNHVDLDVVIANQAGRSIGVIFEEKGEKAFRDFEELALESKISNQEPLVISTGGGIVERAANRELLKEKSFVIWLRADTETLVKRVGNHPLRPLNFCMILNINCSAGLVRIGNGGSANCKICLPTLSPLKMRKRVDGIFSNPYCKSIS